MLLDRRIVDKCLLDKECTVIVELLNPFQLSTDVAGGAEVIVHTTNMLRDSIDRKTFAEVDLDLQNAYGRRLHQTAIDSVVDKLPGMAQFVVAIYTQAGRLYYKDHAFSLTSGVDQGDPLVGLLFSLTLHAFLFKVHNIIPDLQLTRGTSMMARSSTHSMTRAEPSRCSSTTDLSTASTCNFTSHRSPATPTRSTYGACSPRR
jgi:hypothetical protein